MNSHFPIIALLLLSAYAGAQEAEVKALPNGGSPRHQILLEERKAIADELTAAINAHPQAQDKDKSAETIKRLERNLHSIEAEISKAAREPPTVVNFKPAPVAAKPDIETNHETWDVFQDFGTKKGK